MFPVPVDTDALLRDAKRVSRKAWIAVLTGLFGVPALGALVVFTIFRGPLGENGTNGVSFIFLLAMMATMAATPVLTVMWSVQSYQLQRSAAPDTKSRRPLARLMPIAVLILPLLMWAAAYRVLSPGG